MSKTLQEQIEVMQHFANGGEVERSYLDKNEWNNELTNEDSFNWVYWDYRIKEQKKTITIEKWLLKTYSESRYDIAETSNITDYVMGCIGWEKVKLLETYEVEL